MSMATPQVYVAELERLKFGRPLYNPEHPVNIGDVGFFERDTGNFCPLFNVFHDAADLANARLGSPNDFVPLSRTHLRITTTNDYFPPQPIKSGSVESKGVELEASANAIIPAGAGITFSCANKLGATLLLRAATTRADVADNRFVHEYILKHIDSWYNYAYRLGYGEVQAPEGSIVLIKGCDKTSSWAHATFAERSREASVFFNGGYFDVGGTVRLQGSWSGAVSAIYREAPLGGRQVHPVIFYSTHKDSRIVDKSQVATSNNSSPSAIFPEDCNYSVFARVYRIRRRSVLGMAKLVTVNVDGGTTRRLQHRSPSTSGPRTPGPETMLQSVSSFSTYPTSHQAKPHAAQAARSTLTQLFRILSLRAASRNDPTLTLSAQTNRPPNTSLSSTATTSSLEHGNLIRAASSLLCRELGRSGGQLRRNDVPEQDWEEIDNRMRNLIRLERMWARSDTGGQGNIFFVSGASGEVSLRRAFSEALRDGYVLCQFINKLRPGSLTNPRTRNDGFVRTSNVTRFLATCSQQGVPAEDLFQRDDLIEASAESLARVAGAVLSLFKTTKSPISAERSRLLTGGESSGTQRGPEASSPATKLTSKMALVRSMFAYRNPTQRKPWSPPTTDLPIVMDDDFNTLRETPGSARPSQVNADNRLLVSPPPRSPFRVRDTSSRGGVFAERGSLADRGSLGESLADSRQSLASSTRADTTGFSSSLEVQRFTSSGSARQFGTVHAMTAGATSIHVNDNRSFSASNLERLGRKQPDLQRVVEETESVATSSSSGKKKRQSNMSSLTELGNTDAADMQEKERERKKRINLGTAKWPEDFFDAMQQNTNATALAEETSRKIQSDRAGPPPLTPKRPSHHARHSVDISGFLPPPPRLQTKVEDASPTRAGLRRNNTQSSAGAGPRSAGLLSRIDRTDRDDRSQFREAGLLPLVPFPRFTSGEYNLEGSPHQQSPPDLGSLTDHPPVPRGRFTSEVGGASSRRRRRLDSFDVQGSKPGRSRFESMVNLGGESSIPIAADINSWDSFNIRQTLVVKADGKAIVQYQLGNYIGRGQFGSVYRALNLNTGQMVAIKRIQLKGFKEDEVKQLMSEIDLVKSLSHPSIVKYEGMSRDYTTLSIMLEFAENGSLGQTLKAFGQLNERLVASYVVKILDGLLYLHKNHVVHSDLKAANILTTKTGNVKLSDFGVSLNLRNLCHIEKERQDVAGTLNWMAPEVIELKGASYASDIWSLACTVIELLTGRPPYSDVPNHMSIMFRIVEDDMPHLPEGCSEPLEDFLRQCFNKDPSKRPTAEDLCEHEWLKVTWGAGRDPYEQDSIPFLRQISTDVKQSWPSIAQHLAQSDNPPRSETSDSDDGPKPKPKLTPTLNKRNSNARSAGWPPFSDTSNMGSSLPTKDSVPSPWMISDVHQTLSGVTSPSPNPDPPFTFKGVSPFKRSSSSWSLPEPIVALSTPSTKDEIFVRTRRRTRASSLGSARPGDAAELLEPKTQEQLSFLNLRDESWDDEPSIMVHPDLQLGGHILDHVLDYILKKAPDVDVVIATDEDLFTLCPGSILPSDITDMLNNLQPPCYTNVAFGGKTLATLKESTMKSSHGSQDQFQANAKSSSSQVHAFVPSVGEEDQNQDDDDMGGGNSKGKSRDTKSSVKVEALAQGATQSATPPAEKKGERQASAATRSSWIGRWFKRGSSTTPAPVEASLDE